MDVIKSRRNMDGLICRNRIRQMTRECNTENQTDIFLFAKSHTMSTTTTCTASEAGSTVSPIFIMHQVSALDNLTALAVRYRTSVAAIRRMNPELVLKHQIPPTAKNIKIPFNPSARKASLEESVEKKAQTEANERFYKVKAFASKFNCEEEEARIYLDRFEYDMEKALSEREQEVKDEKIRKFVYRLNGNCTVEDAECWLARSNWKIEMALHMFRTEPPRRSSVGTEMEAGGRSVDHLDDSVSEADQLLSNCRRG